MTEHLTPLFTPPVERPVSPLAEIVIPRRVDLGRDSGLVVASSTIDHSGRVPAARLLNALGWHIGLPTRARLRGDAIVVEPDSDSPHRIDSRRQAFVPAGLRALAGITTGDRVLLTASPATDTLIVHPGSVLRLLVSGHLTPAPPCRANRTRPTR
ncbi:hypothetical protein ACQPZF_27375 [Actinosynnema sp. CS-041913]|uniref:hypothetical protein n=1 Tax=Actinosynnema sp. CS-041913 TaxID=3239917 RepID=UPI003D900D23